MTTLPRIATAGELAKLRSDNQSSRLYLTIHSPATVYTARLAAVPSSTDKVASITYNTGSGTLANVLADMTLLVGSTAGAYDVGIARIRKDGTTTAGTFYIGETSEINWTSNAYLTVLDSFELWPRHVNIASDGTTPLMDYDVSYTNQNVAAGAIPTPIMGSHAVLWLNGASVTYSPDASSSWVKDGTITAYSWACTGATVTNGTTATPTITFTSAGTYRLALTVTGDNAVTFTGYRYVFVVTESSGVTTQFALESCAGDYDTGGWTYRVTLYDEATQALIRDRALCILHSVDYYGDTLGSFGYVAGAENVVAIGWISGESIVWASEEKAGSVSFDVQGPQYWLGQMTAFPSGVKDVSDAATPNKWTKFRGLTLNKCWYHFMRWRCTATRCIDVYPIDDSRRIKRLESPGGQNIWAQLTEIAKRSILAEPCADRYSRLFLQINHQYVTDRSSMPTVQAITSADWRDSLTLDRAIVDATSLVDLSGVAWDGLTSQSYFSLAPGHVFNHYGAVEVVDRLALIDQSTSNTLAGLYSARQNNPYPKIDLQLGANHRLIDIAPYQRVTLAVSSSDTVRGITESLTLIPRGVSYGYQDGYVLTDVMCEAEVTAALAVTGDTPPDPPDVPVLPIDPPIDPPPIDPVLPVDAREVWIATDSGILWSTDFFTAAAAGGQPTWNAVANVLSDFGAGKVKQFWIAEDGSAAYVYYSAAAGYPVPWDSSQAIYKCTNPKAATPTWTVVMAYLDAVPWGESLYHFPGFNRRMNKLIVRASTSDDPIIEHPSNLAYCEYNGTDWTFVPMATPPSGTTAYFGDIAYQAVVGTLLNELHQRKATDSWGSTPALLGSWGNSGAVNPRPYLSSTGEYYVVRNHSGVNYIHKVVANTDVLSGFTDANGFPAITGGDDGTRLTYVTSTGALWLSNDGSSFANSFTWQFGQVAHAKRSGIGPLVWLATNVTANNEFIRVNSNGLGATWLAMTGNMWSIISGDQTFINLQLVY